MPNIRLILILQVALIGVLLMSAGEAQAKTYYVSATGSGSCTVISPCSFGTAHKEAVAGDVIEFVGGRHAMTNKITVSKAITLRGSSAEQTVLDFSGFTFEGDGGAVYIRHDDVTLEDLSIENVITGGLKVRKDGVLVNGDAWSSPRLNNITIQRVRTINTWCSGISVNASDNVIVQNCNVSYAMRSRSPEALPAWGTALVFHTVHGGVMKNNVVSYSRGEGISVTHCYNENIIIENSIVFDCAASGIYPHSCRNSVVRNNIVYKTINTPAYGPDEYLSPNAPPGIGFAGEFNGVGQAGWAGVNAENCGTTNYGMRVYGNVVANYGNGLNYFTSGSALHDAGCSWHDNLIFNNTILGGNPGVPDKATLQWHAHSSLPSSNRIFNNIFWQLTSGKLADITESEAVFGPNTFNKDPGDSDAKHVNDPGRVGNVYPTLDIANYFEKTSGWSSIAPGSITNMNYWRLRSTATNAIDDAIWVTKTTSGGTGTVIPVTALPTGHRGYFHTGDIIQFEGKSTPMTVVSSTNSTITVNTAQTWTNGVGIGLAYSGAARDNGALEYSGGGGDTQAPSAPGGLSVR